MVGERRRPLRPRFQQPGPDTLQERTLLRLRDARQAEHALSLEIARLGDAEQRGGPLAVLLAEHVRELPRRPHEEGAFLSLAIRVGGGPEGASGIGHLARHVVQHVRGDLAE